MKLIKITLCGIMLLGFSLGYVSADDEAKKADDSKDEPKTEVKDDVKSGDPQEEKKEEASIRLSPKEERELKLLKGLERQYFDDVTTSAAAAE